MKTHFVGKGFANQAPHTQHQIGEYAYLWTMILTRNMMSADSSACAFCNALVVAPRRPSEKNNLNLEIPLTLNGDASLHHHLGSPKQL